MADDRTARAQALVDQPRETLDTELKSWLDLATAHGQGHLVRAALALRNHGGGQIVFGFHDETHQPEPAPPGVDVRAAFHSDVLQALVSRYASQPFEVGVEFGERNGQWHPVLFVPADVRTPVAAKSDLKEGDKFVVKVDEVYVRTLNANRVASTSRATWKDWEDLAEICFNNREADIGRFIRRHLGALTPDHFRDLALTLGAVEALDAPDPVLALLDAGEQRFATVVAERGVTLPQTGFWSIACVIEGTVPEHPPTREFLDLLAGHNPRLTGWPLWLDGSSFAPTKRPFVYEGTWQALRVDVTGYAPSVDFQIVDPRGRFYWRQALEDDLSSSQRAPEPRTELDFGLPIIRCAEAIAVALAFAKAMGCAPATTTLRFGSRWSGLRGRRLTAWAQPGRSLSMHRTSQQDVVTVLQRVPLETPVSAIGGVLVPMLAPLYHVFEGFELPAKVIEDLSAQLVERRLRG